MRKQTLTVYTYIQWYTRELAFVLLSADINKAKFPRVNLTVKLSFCTGLSLIQCVALSSLVCIQLNFQLPDCDS